MNTLGMNHQTRQSIARSKRGVQRRNEKEEEQDMLAVGRLDIFRNVSHEAPTDEDVTETTTTLDEAALQQQQQQQRPLSEEKDEEDIGFDDSNNNNSTSRPQKQTYGESKEPLSNIIDRLSRVNTPPPRRLKDRLDQTHHPSDNANNNSVVEEMARILSQLDVDDKNDDNHILGSFHGSAVHSFEDDDPNDNENSSAPSFYYGNDEESLSLHKIMLLQQCNNLDDNASGITLDALSHSCSSSVTWWEGDNFEEIEVTSEDEELKEILYAEALSSYAESADEESSGGDHDAARVGSFIDELSYVSNDMLPEGELDSCYSSSYTEVSVREPSSL